MNTKSQRHIANQLREQGYRFSELTLVSEGEYAAEDIDWNYKDVVHIRYVHPLARQTQFLLDRSVMSAVHFQKLMGFWFPMLHISYESERFRQISISTFFFFVVITETYSENIECVRGLKARATTKYLIGSPKLFFFLTPLLRWAIAKNYRALMKNDIPMRERRGILRKIGYTFRTDREPCGYIDTVDTSIRRVEPPPNAPHRVTCLYRNLLEKDGEQLIGDSGLLGFRLVRSGPEVTIYPRACPHEGASLDNQTCKSGVVLCPWHGRQIRPLAKFEWGQNVDLEASNYHVSVVGEELAIEWKANSRF